MGWARDLTHLGVARAVEQDEATVGVGGVLDVKNAEIAPGATTQGAGRQTAGIQWQAVTGGEQRLVAADAEGVAGGIAALLFIEGPGFGGFQPQGWIEHLVVGLING